MELTFLGTSAGVPTRERNVSALALRLSQRRGWLLFDCGEGTQHRILRTPLSLYTLEKIFISHLHGDHVYGLWGLLASRGMLLCDAPLELYGPPGLNALVEGVRRLSQLNLPYELRIRELSGGECLDFDGYTVRVLPLSHSITSYGYCLVEAERPGRFDPEAARRLGIPEGPLWGRIQRGESLRLPDGRRIDPSEILGPSRPGRRLAIAGDNDQPERFASCAPLDLLVHEATYLQEDFDHLPRKFQHTTALQLGRAAEAMGVGHLVATHFSPRYDSDGDLRRFEEEIHRHYRGRLTLARDMLTLRL